MIKTKYQNRDPKLVRKGVIVGGQSPRSLRGINKSMEREKFDWILSILKAVVQATAFKIVIDLVKLRYTN